MRDCFYFVIDLRPPSAILAVERGARYALFKPYAFPILLLEIHTERRLFGGAYNFIPDFFLHWKRRETIGNILAFLPFGILYPLAKSGRRWKQTVMAGFLCSLTIEILQPVVGRAFDINDIILNTLGVLISASAFCAISELLKKRKAAS